MYVYVRLSVWRIYSQIYIISVRCIPNVVAITNDRKIHTQEKYTRATRGRFIKGKKEGNNIFYFSHNQRREMGKR